MRARIPDEQLHEAVRQHIQLGVRLTNWNDMNTPHPQTGIRLSNLYESIKKRHYFGHPNFRTYLEAVHGVGPWPKPHQTRPQLPSRRFRILPELGNMSPQEIISNVRGLIVKAKLAERDDYLRKWPGIYEEMLRHINEYGRIQRADIAKRWDMDPKRVSWVIERLTGMGMIPPMKNRPPAPKKERPELTEPQKALMRDHWEYFTSRIRAFARKKGMDVDQALNDGLDGLERAAINYHPESETPFQKYAQSRVFGRIFDAYREKVGRNPKTGKAAKRPRELSIQERNTVNETLTLEDSLPSPADEIGGEKSQSPINHEWERAIQLHGQEKMDDRKLLVYLLLEHGSKPKAVKKILGLNLSGSRIAQIGKDAKYLIRMEKKS